MHFWNYAGKNRRKLCSRIYSPVPVSRFPHVSLCVAACRPRHRLWWHQHRIPEAYQQSCTVLREWLCEEGSYQNHLACLYLDDVWNSRKHRKVMITYIGTRWERKKTCRSLKAVLLFVDNFSVDNFNLPFPLLISFMASSSSPARMNWWSLSAVRLFCTTEQNNIWFEFAR